MALEGQKISTKSPITIKEAYEQNAIMLLTIPQVNNYIFPFNELIDNFNGYVKLNSDTQQIITSSLLIDTTSENSKFILNDSVVYVGDIFNTSGLGVADGTNYIMMTSNNELNKDGPTLFIGDKEHSYSRLNNKGYYLYNNDGVGIDAYQYVTNGIIYGNMTQRMQPNDNNFYWDVYFPNVYFKIQSSGNGYGDVYMNSPTSSALAQILLGSTNPQFYLGNLPLKTNTGIYGSGHKFGIEFTDDTKISFVKTPQNEIASIFTVNSEAEFKLGEYDNYDNVLYFMQPSTTSLTGDTLMYAYDARTNSHGTSQIQIRTDGFYNSCNNQTASTIFRWNHSGVESTTDPNNISTWLHSEAKLGSYSSISELRSHVNETDCHTELSMTSSKSTDFVTLRAGYGNNDTRIDLKGTLTRFSSIDSSQLLTYTSIADVTKYFTIDLQYKQINISGLEVNSVNGTTFLSPTLTGIPIAPTITDFTDSSTSIATTEFVQNKITLPHGNINIINTSTSITPTDGSMYILRSQTPITVTISGGSGTCFIQNETVDNMYILPSEPSTIVFNDVMGSSTGIQLPKVTGSIASATFVRFGSGHIKI